MKRNYLPFTLIFLLPCFCVFYSAAQPIIGEYNVYYGHLHNHTLVSDGTGTPDQAYKYAKETAGLDFFGLSDHSEMMTSTEWTDIKNAAEAYDEDGVFTTFYGFEWSSLNYGHVSVINTIDYCSYTSSATNTFSELLKWVNARNGIAFFNHPGWAWWAFQEFNHFTNTPSDKFVGMELWNDVDGFSKYYYNDGFYSNDGGKNYFDEALARGWKIGAAGSDDNHVSTWGTRTPWRVGVLANALTRNDILNALIARRFFSTLDKNLSLSLKVNGAEMGSTVLGGNLTIEINAKDEDITDAFRQVVLMKNGAVAKTIDFGTWLKNVSISLALTGVDKDYFYVKVTQGDGDEAISSPVFIEGNGNQAPVVSITSPTSGTQFNEGDPINITATATDIDGIKRVEFYADDLKLGEDLITPYTYTWTDATAGTYFMTAKAYDNLGASTVSAAVSITVNPVVQPPVPGIAESTILQGSDDAEQYSKGSVVLNSTNLNLVYDSKTTGNQIVGLLFRNLGIPQGANITNAYIEFMVDKRTTNSCSLVIKGEADDNATEFAAETNNLGKRTTTSSSLGWSPAPWNVVGSLQQTPDIKQVIQEIVKRPGWTTSSKLVILITGTGTRNAESFEGLSSGAPLLHVEYTTTIQIASAKSGTIQETSPLQTVTKDISEEGILVYPNPVHDVLTVKFDGKTDVERILVYSITGSLVKEIKVNKVMSETQVDCSNFVPGTYLLKLSNSKGSYSMQFIKQ